jgi:hypothetical protein
MTALDLRAAIVVAREALPHAPTQTDALRLGYLLSDLERQYASALGMKDRPSTEQMATAMLKDAGNELAVAGKALTDAAQALKFAGKGLHANAAIQAATRALQAAQGLGA